MFSADEDTQDRLLLRPFLSTRMALVVLHSPSPTQVGACYPIRLDGPVSIGRDSDCNVVLVGDEAASRQHCVLHRKDDLTFATDRGSTQGTFLNAARRPFTSTQLRHGDRLYIGSHVLKYLESSELEPELANTASALHIHDGLTALPNGRWFLRLLRERLLPSSEQPRGEPFVVVTVSICDPQKVRADHAHCELNLIESAFANRFSACSIARVRDAVFCVLLPNTDAAHVLAWLYSFTEAGRAIDRHRDVVNLKLEWTVSGCTNPAQNADQFAHYQRMISSPQSHALIATDPSHMALAIFLLDELRKRTRQPWLLSGSGALAVRDGLGAFHDEHDRGCVILILGPDAWSSSAIEIDIQRVLAREARLGCALLIPVLLDRKGFERWSPVDPTLKQALLQRELFDFTNTNFAYPECVRLAQRLAQAASQSLVP